MTIVVIIILFIALSTAFGVLSFSAWQVRTGQRLAVAPSPFANISARKIERYVLYLVKHLLQSLILGIAHIWYLVVAKVEKFFREKWPYVKGHLVRRGIVPTEKNGRPSFIRKSIRESRIKMTRIKQRIKEAHRDEE